MSECDYNPKNVRTAAGETRIRAAEACFHSMYEAQYEAQMAKKRKISGRPDPNPKDPKSKETT